MQKRLLLLMYLTYMYLMYGIFYLSVDWGIALTLAVVVKYYSTLSGRMLFLRKRDGSN